ncbi:copper-binding protein [Paraburkholderia bannensis]|uniref:copper-binding protein n=1 Tax=Paraburkholderia bannensis TaxID=765414 RepID=UPI002ABE91B9|nr:copper-binding protein [Paraburkholderia bannensis]
MKRFLIPVLLACATGAYASYALAGDDMGAMNMQMKPSSSKPVSDTALSNAEVVKVDAASGMVTLKHGELANIGMPAMTMAYKAKDAAMVLGAHPGEKVKVRVENVNGAPTIVKLVKASS